MSNPSLPVHSPKELVDYARANPGKLSYASRGIGSSGHLAAEQFKQMHDLDIVAVHYRGAAPALQDSSPARGSDVRAPGSRSSHRASRPA